jgi:hypothetical protein
MSVVEKTLQENYIYFIKELVRINQEIKELPVGNISAKKIGKSTYYYRQWREDRKIKSVSLGNAASSDLLEAINKRQLLEKQKKEVLDNIRVIAKAINTQRVTAEEIIKIISQHGIKSILIGSYCMPVIKDELGITLPTIKTQDIDFLVNIPYKGKEADVESILKPMGFSIGFASDGSTYFTNGMFKIEFLTPEKGRGSDKALSIHPLKIRATPLRYLQMLSEQPLQIDKEDYVFFIPNPWTLAFHKILISQKRKAKDKKEKDLLQAAGLLRGIRNNPDMFKKALLYLDTLPRTWAKHIKGTISEYLPDFFITSKQR